MSRPETRFALKIDVDTHAGLERGVPALAALIASHGIAARAVPRSRAVEEVRRSPSRPSTSVTNLLEGRLARSGARVIRRPEISEISSRTGTDGTDANRGHPEHLAAGPRG